MIVLHIIGCWFLASILIALPIAVAPFITAKREDARRARAYRRPRLVFSKNRFQ